MRRVFWSAFVLFGLLMAAGPVRAASVETLEIVTKTGVYTFAVELAVTDAERAKGLMFRKQLPDGRGMLFDFHGDEQVSMWMKNPHIPLDMLFIRADGHIARIAENPEPFSERIIS